MNRSEIRKLKRLKQPHLMRAAVVLLLARSVRLEHPRLSAVRLRLAVETGAIDSQLGAEVGRSVPQALERLERAAIASEVLLRESGLVS